MFLSEKIQFRENLFLENELILLIREIKFHQNTRNFANDLIRENFLDAKISDIKVKGAPLLSKWPLYEEKTKLQRLDKIRLTHNINCHCKKGQGAWTCTIFPHLSLFLVLVNACESFKLVKVLRKLNVDYEMTRNILSSESLEVVSTLNCLLVPINLSTLKAWVKVYRGRMMSNDWSRCIGPHLT